MALKKAHGNMYEWVTHMHSHLAGECSHECSYCYVVNPRSGRPERYCGPLRIVEDEFKVNYGEGKTIFIEHMNDMLAADVPDEFVQRILAHCCMWPHNTYVFQTKNPARYQQRLYAETKMYEGVYRPKLVFPPNCILGTTIETNRKIPEKISKAPDPFLRVSNMVTCKKFVTIEPVMDFDVETFASMIGQIKPDFINLGADSKNRGLPEPTIEKIEELTRVLKDTYGIELREKYNLKRLKRGEAVHE